jgi:hypothetical protein
MIRSAQCVSRAILLFERAPAGRTETSIPTARLSTARRAYTLRLITLLLMLFRFACFVTHLKVGFPVSVRGAALKGDNSYHKGKRQK